MAPLPKSDVILENVVNYIFSLLIRYSFTNLSLSCFWVVCVRRHTEHGWGKGGKLVEVNQEVKSDFELNTMVAQLNELATKLFRVET